MLLWLVENVFSPIKTQQAKSWTSAATYNGMEPNCFSPKAWKKTRRFQANLNIGISTHVFIGRGGVEVNELVVARVNLGLAGELGRHVRRHQADQLPLVDGGGRVVVADPGRPIRQQLAARKRNGCRLKTKQRHSSSSLKGCGRLAAGASKFENGRSKNVQDKPKFICFSH